MTFFYRQQRKSPFLQTIHIDEAHKSPQLLESICSPRLRTWGGGFVVAFYRRCSGGHRGRRIEHYRPAKRLLTADWHTGFNVDLDARHDSGASARAHRDAARLFARFKANSIRALLLHLAAVERLYQLNTFEGRKWDDWDELTVKEWGVPAGLGEAARQTIRGHELAYYLDRLREGREHTLAELRKRDDTWLMQIDNHWVWGPTNNYCKWFHVCEHESNHNGQVKWIKGRLPDALKSQAS